AWPGAAATGGGARLPRGSPARSEDHDLIAGGLVGAEPPRQVARDHRRPSRPRTAQGHAGVDGTQDTASAQGVQVDSDRGDDLIAEALLHLRAGGILLRYPRQLREPDDPGTWLRQVTDRRRAGQWQQGMLTVVGEMTSDQERRVWLAREAIHGARVRCPRGHVGHPADPDPV